MQYSKFYIRGIHSVLWEQREGPQSKPSKLDYFREGSKNGLLTLLTGRVPRLLCVCIKWTTQFASEQTYILWRAPIYLEGSSTLIEFIKKLLSYDNTYANKL